MDDESVSIKVEDTIFSSKNLSSDVNPIEFLAVQTKVKIEPISEVKTDATYEPDPSFSIADYVKKEIKAESVDSLSRGLESPAECLSSFTDSSHFVDADVIIKKEEDLGTYFEEETGSFESDFDSGRSFENEEDPLCCDEAQTNQGADESYGSEHSSVVSSCVKAEDYHSPVTECASGGTSKGPFLCAECGSRFKERWIFKQHLVVRHRKLFSCPYCLAAFSIHDHLLTHLGTHSGKRLFSCKNCTATFINKEHLFEHLASYSNKRPFMCIYCKSEFSKNHELRLHLITHLNEDLDSLVGQDIPPFPCGLCLALFSDNKALKGHMTHHYDRLNSHERSADEESSKRDLTDNSVQNSSSSSSSVICFGEPRPKLYRVSYSGAFDYAEIPYQCKLCSCQFDQPSSLKLHMAFHSKMGPFACNQCGQKFLKKEHLDQHLNIHSINLKQKQFSCPHCAATFKDIITFQTHTIDHLDPSEKKRFTCAHCPERFRSGEHLRQHLLIHSNDIVFSCARCSETFNQKVCLRKHMKTHMSSLEGK